MGEPFLGRGGPSSLPFPLSAEMTAETVTLSLTPLINKAIMMTAKPSLAPAGSHTLFYTL